MPLPSATSPLARWRWIIRGQVQGVGFRPFVYRAARALRLSGMVRNDACAVVIECQGKPAILRKFEASLRDHPPAAAVVREIERQRVDPVSDDRDFRIEPSPHHDQAPAGADVTIDTATCPACVREILDPKNRRYGYPLTNCTECGPRFSIIVRTPYDRCNTTMSHFEMCPSCRNEYHDPADRRFHAQPTACPDCGPTVTLVNPWGERIEGDPVATARQMLRAGRILAIKGLGGFHLAVRADDDLAVRRLRALKKRDHKPFALMAPSMAEARKLIDLSANGAAAMQSPACPIVLAVRRDDAAVSSGVAPGTHRLGVMLPYTPIHHLLFQNLPTLVMTSGNLSDEPLAIENDDALERLGPMCDALLWHDRPIQRGIDDSIFIDTRDSLIPLRRARGYVPQPIQLASVRPETQGLCLGGELKNTIAVVRDQQAILSHHLGDLTHPRAFEAFVRAIEDFCDLFRVNPQWIAHDLHPAYLSTVHARKLATKLGIPAIAVQHHHAHAVSVMVEHGVTGRTLAVVCDGTGFGEDREIWGGELLAADLRGFTRLARLKPLRLPGGDAAARDTRRSALALLHQAYGSDFVDLKALPRLFSDAQSRSQLCTMIRKDIHCVHSSGAGRVFDAFAALLGLCAHNHYEAQAAMSLEAAAYRWGQFDRAGKELFEIHGDGTREIDLSPLTRVVLARLERGTPIEELAALFHAQFAWAWASAVMDASAQSGIKTVALSGGVFCNAVLASALTDRLERAGLRVLRHRLVPPNDGGLSLGQAAIAAARGGDMRIGKDGM